MPARFWTARQRLRTMLGIGRFETRTCAGFSRRRFLQLAATVPLGAALPIRSAAAAVASEIEPPRARSVVLLWLWGAPSHLDTFDPKPSAPVDIRGPFTSIETRTPGLHLSELLPRLATCSQLYSVVRSHMTFAPGHPDAGTYGLTGFAEQPTPVQPNFGSIVARHRGQQGPLPSFVSIGRGIPRDVVRIVDGYGGGKLGKNYDPFQVGCSAEGVADIPSLGLLDELSPHRLRDRQDLSQLLGKVQRETDGRAFNRWGHARQRAYELLTRPKSLDALDLTRESAATRAAYGHTSFGQSCLMARRLVEVGIPYIQVNWSQYVEAMTPNCDFGWDTHIYNFELLQDRHCPIFDRALSAFLLDLEQRGLLDTTLVVAIGEFGRSPKITDRAARDHWPQCYSSIWAGAGLPGGRVIGASDKHGAVPVTPPFTPLMVGTTLSELAGVSTQVRAELKVLEGGTIFDELLG